MDSQKECRVEYAAETQPVKFLPGDTVERLLRIIGAPFDAVVERDGERVSLDDELVEGAFYRVIPSTKTGAES